MEGVSKKDIGVFPGSFDPFHNGHFEVLMMAKFVYQKIVILVANNPEKRHFNSLNIRASLIKKVVDDSNILEVSVKILDENDTVANFMNVNNFVYIIRGLKKSKNIIEYESKVIKEYKNENEKIIVDFIINDSSVSSREIVSDMRKNISIKEKVPISIHKKILKLWI